MNNKLNYLQAVFKLPLQLLYHKSGGTFWRLKDEMRINLVSSSLSSSHQYNIQTAEQLQRSQFASNSFLQMLNENEVVFYLGHSRKGGGPDFQAPILKNGKVDYDYYQRKTPGLKQIKNALPSSSVNLLGLYSCDSEKNFNDQLLAVSPELNLVLTEKTLSANEAFTKMMVDLKKLLSNKCL